MGVEATAKNKLCVKFPIGEKFEFKTLRNKKKKKSSLKREVCGVNGLLDR
jgi:hypothetical protein